MGMSLSNSRSLWWTRRPGVLRFIGLQRVGHDWETELNIKSRDITLPTKIGLVKAMVFPMVMYGCESWTVKKAEHWRIDAFELWCWRLLRVPWTARRTNQSVLKEISPGCSLEGLMLKLKLQYFGHLMRRVDWLEKTLMLGGIGGRRRRDDRGWDGWMASPTWWTWVWVNSGSWWWTGRPGVLQFMGSQGIRHNWVTELNWSVLNNEQCLASFHVFVSHLYVFFGEISVSVFSPLFDWVVCFSGIELYELLVYFGN